MTALDAAGGLSPSFVPDTDLSAPKGFKSELWSSSLVAAYGSTEMCEYFGPEGYHIAIVSAVPVSFEPSQKRSLIEGVLEPTFQKRQRLCDVFKRQTNSRFLFSFYVNGLSDPYYQFIFFNNGMEFIDQGTHKQPPSLNPSDAHNTLNEQQEVEIRTANRHNSTQRSLEEFVKQSVALEVIRPVCRSGDGMFDSAQGGRTFSEGAAFDMRFEAGTCVTEFLVTTSNSKVFVSHVDLSECTESGRCRFKAVLGCSYRGLMAASACNGFQNNSIYRTGSVSTSDGRGTGITLD
jgi:hypothetical protein